MRTPALGLAEVTSGGVVFDDGSAVDADSVVLCAGFEEGVVPFLCDRIDLGRLYKSCKVYTMGFSGVQYRLRGPHSAPEVAATVIMHSHSHVRFVRFLDLAFSVIARAIGMCRLGPYPDHAGASGRPADARSFPRCALEQVIRTADAHPYGPC